MIRQCLILLLARITKKTMMMLSRSPKLRCQGQKLLQGKGRRVGLLLQRRKPEPSVAKCWKYFKLVKVVSKRKPNEVVEMAKCLGCFKLLCYQGRTTSLNRHRDSCYQLQNKKARAFRQGTTAFDPKKAWCSLIVNHSV